MPLDTSEVKRDIYETEQKIIKQILTDHSIPWEMKDGKIIVENEFTLNGKIEATRIEAPTTVKRVLIWLGY